MIDEKAREQIDRYLLNPPDPTLRPQEYYYLQSTMGGERVIRVQVREILPCKEGTEYGIFQGNRRVDVGYGDPFRGCRKHELYDNKQDCKAQTHMFCEEWEHLRFLQREEVKEG